MTLEKHPTSIQLAEEQSAKLDEIAAKLTLKNGSRFTRADVHRLALSAGMPNFVLRLTALLRTITNDNYRCILRK